YNNLFDRRQKTLVLSRAIVGRLSTDTGAAIYKTQWKINYIKQGIDTLSKLAILWGRRREFRG
ncbi:hypothetical protein OFB74_35695, partial [Escherichia coli]|nr:hypothetical protein [Escherichia coli]